MNRPAIDDLLGGILSGWYQSVAEWTPPGLTSGRTCQSCRSSVLAEAIEIEDWPHELVHQLADLLESAALQSFDSLARPSTSFRSVRDYIGERVRVHAPDLLDVLNECAAPRLDEWAKREVERGLAEVDLLH